MTVSVHFTDPSETSVASRNPAFIESLKAASRHMPRVTVAENAKRADIVLIDERYQYRTWHYADELNNDAFIRNHASRICVLNHDSFARVFLPGLYVSLEKSRPPLIPALPIPYKWDLWKVPVPDRFEFKPDLLYTFRGTFHTHSVRKRMCRGLANFDQGRCEELRKAFHSHDSEDQRRYINEIRRARFSLCPRGLSPSSYRLYESMQLGRCPVVVSDDWLPPPGPDWEDFLLRIPEKQVRALPGILSNLRQDAEQKGRLAREEWQAHFSWPARCRYFLDVAVMFREQFGETQNHAALRRKWRDRKFHRQYKWTMVGRAQQFVARHYRALTERPVQDGPA